MSFSDPKTVFEESRALFFLTGLLGLRAFGPRNQRWISCIYAFFLPVLYCFLFFKIREWTRSYYEKFQTVIYYFKLQEKLPSYVHPVVVTAIILSSVLKSPEYYSAYKKLDAVDQVLYYLNSGIDHKLQMKKEVVRLSIYVSVTVFANLITYFAVVNMDSSHVLDVSWMLDHVPVFLEIVTICAFDIFVGKILVRFQEINRIIQNLVLQGPKRTGVALVQATEMNNGAKFRLTRRVHRELHDAASAINRAYGLRLFFVFFATLISVLTHFRRSLDLLDNAHQLLDLSLHLIGVCFHVGKYFYLANTCRAAIAEAKLPEIYFLEDSIMRGPGGFGDEVKAFSRQLTNKRLELTVWTVSSIDFPKGFTIFTGTLIYLAFLG